MKMGLCKLVPILLLLSSLMLCGMRAVEGIRFVIDREECFSHNVVYERDTVHVSFVVIKAETSWQYSAEGVDLLVMGPAGEKIYEVMEKTSDKFEFVSANKGLHRFCFINRSPSYHETVDFDVYVSHFSHHHQLAKDEHFNPLLQQISKLEEALYNIQFEQHWLEAQTERQAIDNIMHDEMTVNDALSSRAMHKAIFESAVLIGGSFLQVFLLRRLFEQKGAPPRV